jgi:hypothetical protein
MEKKPIDRNKATSRTYTLGRKRFAKISAVEGVHLNDEASKDFEEFDRKGLSAGERRERIRRKYGTHRA